MYLCVCSLLLFFFSFLEKKDLAPGTNSRKGGREGIPTFLGGGGQGEVRNSREVRTLNYLLTVLPYQRESSMGTEKDEEEVLKLLL